MSQEPKFLIIEPTSTQQTRQPIHGGWRWRVFTIAILLAMGGYLWHQIDPQSAQVMIVNPRGALAVDVSWLLFSTSLALALGILIGALMRGWFWSLLWVLLAGIAFLVALHYSGLVEINWTSAQGFWDALQWWITPPHGGWQAWLSSRFLVTLFGVTGFLAGLAR